ncbi:MAG: 30S ribosomal protein S6 [Patescibacteria group bacterium]|nr:30S ribosomal protein S6 [Patescibacteria group bacterium]
MQTETEMEAANKAVLDDMDAEITADADSDDKALSAIYEVGYHFLPTVPEEGLTGEVKKLHDFLTENGAEVVGDRFPQSVHLAYTITKRVAGKLERFSDAHFGWVAFEMPNANIARVKTWLDENPSVLRFLIVRTSRDEVAASLSGGAMAHLPTVHANGNIEKPKREAEEGGEVSEKALDEALESIQAEDAQASE